MSSKQMGDQAYSKKGWFISRKEGTKAFLKRLALCSDMANSKDPPKAIWVLASSQIVRRVWKWKRKGSKFQNQEKGKWWVTYMHTGTAVAWDNRAKQRRWKCRFKVNKKYERPVQSTGITANNNTNNSSWMVRVRGWMQVCAASWNRGSTWWWQVVSAVVAYVSSINGGA